MRHTMKLFKVPYDMIKNGIKTIELRLNDEKRQRICIDDVIEFQSAENPNEAISCKVIGLYPYSSFRELYEALPLLKCGYTEDDVENAKPEDMNKYYTTEQQKLYGVLGIEVELL